MKALTSATVTHPPLVTIATAATSPRNRGEVLHDHTAGDPMKDDVRWTDLTATDVAERLAAAGSPVSTYVVEQLFEQAKYGRRQ